MFKIIVSFLLGSLLTMSGVYVFMQLHKAEMLQSQDIKSSNAHLQDITPLLLPDGKSTPYAIKNGAITFENKPILGADLKTFHAIGKIENIPSTNFYAVDSSHAYEDDSIIEGADPSTLEVLHDYQVLEPCRPHAGVTCRYYDLKDAKHKFNGSMLME